MPLNVVIACGGTGGHLFPGVAVAEELVGRGHSVLALISEKSIDARASERYRDLQFERLPAVGMPRLLSPAMLKFVVRFLQTRRACGAIVARTRADAVLGMGGFTSLPPVMAGRRAGAKTFVHESNAFPGKANRWTAKFCDEVLLGFEVCAREFPGRSTRVVGTPVREDLAGGPGRAEARAAFGLGEGAPVLMVMGGSQGARAINRALAAALPDLAAAGVQVLHLSGPADFDEAKAAHGAAGSTGLVSHVAPFCDDIGRAYAAADLVVARSGASSLAEFAAVGLPSLLVPYPYAADDHQAKNADVFKAANAALVMDERNLTGKSLATAVTEVLADTACLEALAEKARSLATPGAAAAIADRIEEVCAGAGTGGSGR